MTPLTAPELRPNTRDARVLEEQRQYLSKIRLTPGDRWLDGGAHIGLFSRAIAPQVAQVVGYEPMASNWPTLERNTAGYANVARVNKALVGGPPLTRTIYQNVAGNTGAHSFYITRARPALTVPCDAIDAVIARWGITKIKLDVEGAEEEIVYGCTLLPQIDALILEWHFKIRPEPPPYPRYEAFLAHLRAAFPHVVVPVHKLQWTVLVHAYR